MIIEYTDTARKTEILGIDYKAQLFHRGKRDTNIVDELWTVIKNNLDVKFMDLKEVIKQAYENKKSRSRIDIIGLYGSDNYIEMTNKGVFPNILILKND